MYYIIYFIIYNTNFVLIGEITLPPESLAKSKSLCDSFCNELI